MTTSKFKGTGVALVTPFNAKGQINYTGLVLYVHVQTG